MGRTATAHGHRQARLKQTWAGPLGRSSLSPQTPAATSWPWGQCPCPRRGTPGRGAGLWLAAMSLATWPGPRALEGCWGGPPQLSQHQNCTQRPGSESREQWSDPSSPGHLCYKAWAGLDGTRAAHCPAGWPCDPEAPLLPRPGQSSLKVPAQSGSTQLHTWTPD